MTYRFTPFSLVLSLAIPLAGALHAQDPSEGGMPSPKTEHHERLAAFAGTWRAETEMAALPGVPGMEKATTMSGTEEARLICDGLWLHVAGDGMCDGQPSSGLWLVGYNPHAASYECIVASSMDDAPCCLEASFDEATKTWHFRGETPMGPFRSELVFETDDRSIETCYWTDESGKEKQFMRSVRTRMEGAADAAAHKIDGVEVAVDVAQPELAPALAALHADCGTWDADFEMVMPGAPAMQSKCRETVVPICGGKWTWSNFSGEIMGMPFEGHALTGYDSKAGKVVSFWVDSMTAPFMRTDGVYDPKTKTFTMRGKSYDEQGRVAPVVSNFAATGKDTRELEMTFGEGEAQSVMTISYRRAAK